MCLCLPVRPSVLSVDVSACVPTALLNVGVWAAMSKVGVWVRASVMSECVRVCPCEKNLCWEERDRVVCVLFCVFCLLSALFLVGWRGLNRGALRSRNSNDLAG